MVASEDQDPLAAWQDCYAITPKKRILGKQARTEIQQACENW